MPARQPNFFIVGAPKCGTSAWVSYLSGHPDVFFTPRKEPHYFCTDFPNFRWAETEEDYLAFFVDAGDVPVIGEASVMYLYSRDAARRIHAFDEQAKILILLRGQGSFLPSYHNQILYTRNETNPDFAEVWRISEQGLPRTIPASCREPAFLDYRAVGDFESQVARYIDTFPSRQLRVVWMEDWRDDPGRLYESLLDFLGLRHHKRESFAPVNTAYQHRSRLLSKLTNNPPSWVLGIARAAKRVLGAERLNIAAYLRRMNRAEGYAAVPPRHLKAQIDAHYREANGRLRARIAELGIGYD